MPVVLFTKSPGRRSALRAASAVCILSSGVSSQSSLSLRQERAVDVVAVALSQIAGSNVEVVVLSDPGCHLAAAADRSCGSDVAADTRTRAVEARAARLSDRLGARRVGSAADVTSMRTSPSASNGGCADRGAPSLFLVAVESIVEEGDSIVVRVGRVRYPRRSDCPGAGDVTDYVLRESGVERFAVAATREVMHYSGLMFPALQRRESH
jgi:hypothetical protein